MVEKWIIHNISPHAQKLAKKYNLNELIVHLLLRREIPEGEFLSFLDPCCSHLHSPLLLPDMERAVTRIQKAMAQREKMCLFGDYDVDGITSLSIFYEYIGRFPAAVSFYIPHRIEEGYGLNKKAIRKIGNEGITLLICFDCGTNAKEEIELARSLGIDVIVVDHHTPSGGENFPYAFINSKRKDSVYPFRDLSGAGLTFKLVQALAGKDCFELLDLVALSVVCDVVPVKGENRIFLKEGIRQLKETSRVGIQALCEISGIKQTAIEPYHLGYILGPRINACGRMADARQALGLFNSSDKEYVRKVALQLDEYNRLRRSVESAILREAEELIEREFKDDTAFVLHKDGWHPGVLGIVAAKLVDRYRRPTFVIGFSEKMSERKGRGSARSIPGFHLMEALELCKDFLYTYGGHKKAAGIEIFKEYIDDFREKLNSITQQQAAEKSLPVLDIDAELPFHNINMAFVEDVEKLKPFGEENNRPLFLTRNLLSKTLPKKKSGNRYFFWVSDGCLTYEALFYKSDEFLDIVNYGSSLDIVYSLEKDYYYNSMRLVIKDLRLS